MPLAAKLCVRPPNVLEVQERARGPLSPYQVWCGSDFIRRRVGEKNVEFFVCPSRFFVRHALSVRHAYERPSLFARFRHEVKSSQVKSSLLQPCGQKPNSTSYKINYNNDG